MVSFTQAERMHLLENCDHLLNWSPIKGQNYNEDHLKSKIYLGILDPDYPSWK